MSAVHISNPKGAFMQGRDTCNCELNFLIHQTREAERIIGHLRQKLDARQRELRQFVEKYNAKWLELFKAELAERKLGYCSRCMKIVPLRQLYLLFFEGFAHEKGCDVAELHLLCGEHGNAIRDYSRRARECDPEHRAHNTYEVEVIDGKKYVRKNGTLVALPPDVAPIPPLELSRIKELMREWKYPLMLSIDSASGMPRFEE